MQYEKMSQFKAKTAYVACSLMSCFCFTAAHEEIHWSPPLNLSLASKTAVGGQVTSGTDGVTSICSRSNGANYIVQIATADLGE